MVRVLLVFSCFLAFGSASWAADSGDPAPGAAAEESGDSSAQGEAVEEESSEAAPEAEAEATTSDAAPEGDAASESAPDAVSEEASEEASDAVPEEVFVEASDAAPDAVAEEVTEAASEEVTAEVTDVEVTDAEVTDVEVTDAEVTDVEVTDAEVTDVEVTDAEVLSVVKDPAEVDIGGYLRVGYSSLTPNRFLLIQTSSSDGNAPYVGRSDGFALGGARLNVRAKYGDRLYLRMGFDGALVERSEQRGPIGELSTGLKDAYLGYVLGTSTALTVGRFKPPFETEGLLSTTDQLFVHRALESRGVACHEGRCEGSEGMSPGRQLGAIIRDNFVMALGPLDMGYAFAVTNGNSGEASLNDNDLLALYGRLMFAWGEARYQQGDEEGPAGYVRVRDGGLLGMVASVNDVTLGKPPTRSQDREIGMGVDLAIGMAGVSVQGQLLVIEKKHLQVIEGKGDREREWGGHLQVGYELLEGLELGARFAYYNPREVLDPETLVDQADYDMSAHVTVGARYAVPSLPLIVFGEFTHSKEDKADQLNNDRLEFAAQVTF